MKGLRRMITAMISTVMMLYACHGSSSNLHPLILVPGDAGSQLEARLTAEYEPSSNVCTKDYPAQKDPDGWFRLWLDPSVLYGPEYAQCFAKRMTIYYDADVDDYRNAPGVETRVPHFGSTEAIRYLNPSLGNIALYMASLVKSLEQIGYVEGETLFGAPYDFRYGLAAEDHPSHVGSKFLQDLKALIEKASTSNGGKRVILVSHSLGGLFVLQLLNRNPTSWRQKYIKHFIALSTPWGGTVRSMLTFASGYTLGVPLLNPLIVRDLERSFESDLWLLPTPKLFGSEKPIVIAPNNTYSAYDIPQFLEDIGFPQGVKLYKSRILPLVKKLPAPKVPITCIIGICVETPETLLYEESGFDEQPKMIFGDGDGTVNMVSLLAIEKEWAKEKTQTLKWIRVPGVDHTGILKNGAALEETIGEICTINSELMLPLVSMKELLGIKGYRTHYFQDGSVRDISII